MSAINGEPGPNEWLCAHCGEWFSIASDTCECGAKVSKEEGVAMMPDKHMWTPDENNNCIKCAKVVAT